MQQKMPISENSLQNTEKNADFGILFKVGNTSFSYYIYQNKLRLALQKCLLKTKRKVNSIFSSAQRFITSGNRFLFEILIATYKTYHASGKYFIKSKKSPRCPYLNRIALKINLKLRVKSKDILTIPLKVVII